MSGCNRGSIDTLAVEAVRRFLPNPRQQADVVVVKRENQLDNLRLLVKELLLRAFGTTRWSDPSRGRS